MPCYVTRPKLRPTNWECDGENLVIIQPATDHYPASVIRRDLVATLLAGEDDDGPYHYLLRSGEPKPLPPGADHLHVELGAA